MCIQNVDRQIDKFTNLSIKCNTHKYKSILKISLEYWFFRNSKLCQISYTIVITLLRSANTVAGLNPQEAYWWPSVGWASPAFIALRHPSMSASLRRGRCLRLALLTPTKSESLRFWSIDWLWSLLGLHSPPRLLIDWLTTRFRQIFTCSERISALSTPLQCICSSRWWWACRSQ